MRLFLLQLLLIGFSNCTIEPAPKRTPYYDFDFSYTNIFFASFSLKLTQNDTVYIRQYFSDELSNTIKANKNYFALLSPVQKAKTDSFLRSINFKYLDSVYEESYLDGVTYSLYVYNDSTQKTIYVHSHHAPKELMELAKWMVALKSQLTHIPLDNTMAFNSAKGFLPVPTPPPAKKE